MIVVELAGASGVGKSTMSALVADRLQEILGQNSVAALPEKNVPRRRRRWTRLKRWAWVATNPRSLVAAWRTTQAHICTASYTGWIRSFSTIGLARKAMEQGVQVVLVDQGILRLPVLPEHVEMLPRQLLPDLVLHLVAEPEIMEKRRLERGKKKCARYQGERRLANVRKTLQRLGKGMTVEERRNLVAKYGEKFCEPAFSEEEIRQLVDDWPPQGPDSAKAEANGKLKTARCHPQVCQHLQLRGIHLEKLDTTWLDVQVTADLCSRTVLTAMKRMSS
ncbi:hypothetical protein WJU23_21065 [Prosthecobacter sp. SYSU 5D2]|uniref:hypothetical protein n=1 Tax=Prosthecobacter sp. SYSU 5D2 TaxID=3134134 RepID=UPI0031FE75B5